MPLSRTLALEARDLHRAELPQPALRDRLESAGERLAASRKLRSRRVLTAFTVAVATAGSLATAPAAEAASSFCSETGDFCTSAAKKNGTRTLAISTFAHRGKVAICVQAGSAEPVCKSRALKGKKGLYSASIKWSANYPRTPKGQRKVTFTIDGSMIGPALTFDAR